MRSVRPAVRFRTPLGQIRTLCDNVGFGNDCSHPIARVIHGDAEVGQKKRAATDGKPSPRPGEKFRHSFPPSQTGHGFGEPRPHCFRTPTSFDDISTEIRWAADGNRLVNRAVRLLKLGADRKNQTQILVGSSATIKSFSPCGSDYFVLMWTYRGGTDSLSAWRMNADVGTQPCLRPSQP